MSSSSARRCPAIHDQRPNGCRPPAIRRMAGATHRSRPMGGQGRVLRRGLCSANCAWHAAVARPRAAYRRPRCGAHRRGRTAACTLDGEPPCVRGGGGVGRARGGAGSDCSRSAPCLGKARPSSSPRPTRAHSPPAASRSFLTARWVNPGWASGRSTAISAGPGTRGRRAGSKARTAPR